MFSVARGRQFLRYILPAVLKPLRILWNQVIGFFFLALALIGAFRLVPFARQFDGDFEDLIRLIVSGIFVALMTFFGIYSFWRAHKVTK